MVDGRAFYIGSDNMYPVNLQEFGYIVDDAKAAQQLTDAYWTPLWQWSSKAAVSGPGVAITTAARARKALSCPSCGIGPELTRGRAACT